MLQDGWIPARHVGRRQTAEPLSRHLLRDSGGLTSPIFHNFGVSFIRTLLAAHFLLLRLEQKMEPCHHRSALSQKIRLPFWTNWFRRVSSVWVGFSTCDGWPRRRKKRKRGIIHIACIAWHSFRYPEKSLFLAWLFFRFTSGIMRLKPPTCADMSRGSVLQENECHCEEFYFFFSL